LERYAAHVLHDHVRRPVGFFNGVDRHNVFVSDGGDGPRLAAETLAICGVARQVRGQHFDRHETVQRRVERLEDNPHAAATDYLDHLVSSQPAEVLRVLRRVQECKIHLASSCRSGLCRRLTRFAPELLHGLFEGGLRGVRRSTQVSRSSGPRRFSGRQLFQRVLAVHARVEVPAQLGLVLLRQATVDQLLQAGGIGARHLADHRRSPIKRCY
jgi:hypothetical protein